LTAESDLVFTGEMASFEDTAETGNKVLPGFCSKCGTAIGAQLAARPGVFMLRAGTLDDTTPLSRRSTLNEGQLFISRFPNLPFRSRPILGIQPSRFAPTTFV